MIRSLFILSLFYWVLAPGVSAARPYEPTQREPFANISNWSKLSFLDQYLVLYSAVGLNGSFLFGTEEGLIIYDGYAYDLYPLPEDSGSISCLHQAEDGTVYALTSQFAFAFADGQWTRLFEASIAVGRWQRIDSSKDGSAWIATSSALYRIKDRQSELVELPYRQFSSLLVDSKNQLWLGEETEGLVLRYQLEEENGEIVGEPLLIRPEGAGRFSRTRLLEGIEGRVWISSFSSKGALRRVQGEEVVTVVDDWLELGIERHVEMFEAPDGKLLAFSSRLAAVWKDGLWSLYDVNDLPVPTAGVFACIDDAGTLVYGGRRDGVFAIDLSNRKTISYEGLNFYGEGADGAEWFLSRDKRVVRFDPGKNIWESYGEEEGLINWPNSLRIASDGRVWVSGSHDGVAALAWLEGDSWYREAHPRLGGLFGHLSHFEGEDGVMYFGSNDEQVRKGNDKGGVVKYTWDGEAFKSQYILAPFAPNRVAGMAGIDGEFWFGGYGLHREERGLPLKKVEGFSDDWVDDVMLSKDREVWIALWGAGVFRLEESEWKRELGLDRLSSRKYVDLLDSQREGGVYLLTGDNGLYRYDGRSWSEYSRFDRLSLSREGGFLKESADGSLWINTASRSWYFSVRGVIDEIEGSHFETMRHKRDGHPPRSRFLSQESRLQESGSAYFAWEARDFMYDTPSEDLEHSYRINGGEWSAFTKDADLLLQNLEAGDYKLEVRTRDADWNLATQVLASDFTVKMFLWKRPWFILTAIVLVGALAMLTYILVRTRIRHLLELKEFKLNFFTNLSHELRTPLSVMIGPLQSLKDEDLGSERNAMVRLCLRNTKKIQGLINHLLEFRKVELGMQEYLPVSSDVVLFIKNSIYHNEALWVAKGHELSLHIEDQERVLNYDPRMLQSIIDNLISNAVKFTPRGGMIDVFVDFPETNDQGLIRIKVRDNGIGIDAQTKSQIFKPFQREKATEYAYEGSGIGLAYCKEIVSLWGGEIVYDSPVAWRDGLNCGTEFKVLLPVRKGIGESSAEVSARLLSRLEEAEEETLEPRGEPVALVVEDNRDVLEFLEIELGKEFVVETAKDGKEGFNKAQRLMPDVIITDVMMPEMDGMELCRELKTEDTTSHIPIVMLTARASDEFKLKGIEQGADDYFPKPVNLPMLKARINALLETRKRLRELFSRQIVLKPKEIAVSSKDEAFLSRAIGIVEDRIADEAFDVDAFALIIGMSRSTLYRKLIAVSGESPSGFIRSIRMKRAAQLLESGQLTVSEVTEQVGILDMSHFGKLFKKEFGQSPTDYKNAAQRREVAN